MRGEFNLQILSGAHIPVQLSIYQLGTDKMSGLAIIATDISERVEAEQKIHALGTAMRQIFAARTDRVSGWLPGGMTSTNGSRA